MTIPERLKDRPTYRGYVVPYTVVMDSEGHVDFRATDMDRWFECVDRDLCAVCGGELDYWVWYIGGEKCANEGVYFDLAMHEECCFYAASVCPFLAMGRDYSESAAKIGDEFRLEFRHDVVKAAALYASKRRRSQTRVVPNGDGYIVKTGPEIERIQIWPKEE